MMYILMTVAHCIYRKHNIANNSWVKKFLGVDEVVAVLYLNQFQI